MFDARLPVWLGKLERRLGWLSLPNLALYLVVAQIFGFIFITIDQSVYYKLVLDPLAVKDGEWWRLVSFLCLPFSTHILFQILMVWFLYFIVDIIEKTMGEFSATFYLLTAILFSNIYAFTFSQPVYTAGYIELGFFLAAAMLAPDLEILLFFIFPIKIKYLGYFALIYFFITLAVADGVLTKIYLLASLGNFFLYFGKSIVQQLINSTKKYYQK